MAGTWVSGGNLNTGRQALGAAGDQTAALSFGGWVSPATYQTVTESYDGSAWSVVNALPATRGYAGGCGTQGAALVAGGYNGASYLSTSLEWDGTNWGSSAALNGGSVSYCTLLGTQGAANLSGGYPTTAGRVHTENYNGTAWSDSGNLNQARYHHMACGTQTAGLIWGGVASGVELSSTEEFNGTTWSAKANLNVAMQAGAGAGTYTNALSIPGTPNSCESFNGSIWNGETNPSSIRYEIGGGGGATTAFRCGGTTFSNLTEEYTLIGVDIYCPVATITLTPFAQIQLAPIICPPAVLTLTGSASSVTKELNIIVPSPAAIALSATAGIEKFCALSETIPSISIDAYTESFWLELEEFIPPITLSANVITGWGCSLDRTIPPITLEACMGAYLSEEIKSFSLVASLDNCADANLTIPSFSIVASVYTVSPWELAETIPSISILASMIAPVSTYRGVVINTRNFANTEYADWNFNSLCFFKGKYFGTDGAKIYELTGDSDNNVNIDATLSLGNYDLFTRVRKYIREIWLTLKNTGALQIKLEQGSDIYYKDTQIASTDIHEERVKVGRGMRDRFGKVTISNVDGSDFDLESINIMVDPSKKRR